MASILRPARTNGRLVDINTVPTVSLQKMFNLAARARRAGIAGNLRRAFAHQVNNEIQPVIRVSFYIALLSTAWTASLHYQSAKPLPFHPDQRATLTHLC